MRPNLTLDQVTCSKHQVGVAQFSRFPLRKRGGGGFNPHLLRFAPRSDAREMSLFRFVPYGVPSSYPFLCFRFRFIQIQRWGALLLPHPRGGAYLPQRAPSRTVQVFLQFSQEKNESFRVFKCSEKLLNFRHPKGGIQNVSHEISRNVREWPAWSTPLSSDTLSFVVTFLASS